MTTKAILSTLILTSALALADAPRPKLRPRRQRQNPRQWPRLPSQPRPLTRLPHLLRRLLPMARKSAGKAAVKDSSRK